jgi:hypothetical protein
LNNSDKYSALHIEDDGEVDNSDDEIQVIENSSWRKSKHSSHHIPKANRPVNHKILHLTDTVIKITKSTTQHQHNNERLPS